MHYVYKYVLNDEILYIGKSDSGYGLRLNQHGKSGDNIPPEGWDDINNSKIFFIPLYNSVMTDVVETELIRRYKPKYNKQKMHSPWIGLPFVEPEWQEFKPTPKEPSKRLLREKAYYYKPPFTSTKMHALQDRILKNWSTWAILNYINKYKCESDYEYAISEAIVYKIPEFPCNYWYQGRLYPMLSGYCNTREDGVCADYISITNKPSLWDNIEGAIKEYSDGLYQDIDFLKKTYPVDYKSFSARKRDKGREFDDIITTFMENFDPSTGIAV